MSENKKVVIIGGGFGGLNVAKNLGNKKGIEVVLIDKNNHHLFQPLLYQVAIAGLAPSDIAVPLRSLVRDYDNVKVVMGDVVNIDTANKKVVLASNNEFKYDELVIATGAKTNYFNHPEWEEITFGLKDLNEAENLRNHILSCLERAEQEKDNVKKGKLLRFVIIGAGPTGVELAGSLSELCKHTLSEEFKNIHSNNAQIILIERGHKILAPFGDELSKKARSQIEELGVIINFGQGVKNIDENGVTLDDGTMFASSTVIWAAGVSGSSILSTVDTEKDHAGRIVVDSHCKLKNHSDVYAIGDASNFKDDKGVSLPGLSPVALQQGKYVAKRIVDSVKGVSNDISFSYVNKGTMATIGRKRAVADLRIMKVSGMLAWLSWLFVHLLFLVSYRNKFIVLFNWAWSYFTYKRGSRLITKNQDNHEPVIEVKK